MNALVTILMFWAFGGGLFVAWVALSQPFNDLANLAIMATWIIVDVGLIFGSIIAYDAPPVEKPGSPRA